MDFKEKVFGLMALLAVIILVIFFFSNSQTSTGPSPESADNCENAKAKTIPVVSGREVLLCEGQTAKFGSFEVTLIEADDVPILVKIVKEGIDEIHPLPDEGLMIDFLSVNSEPGPIDGLMLTIKDNRIHVEPNEKNEFSVPTYTPVIIDDTGVTLMAYVDTTTQNDTAIVWMEGKVPNDTQLVTGWSFDMSLVGASGELVYLGKTDTGYTFKLEGVSS